MKFPFMASGIAYRTLMGMTLAWSVNSYCSENYAHGMELSIGKNDRIYSACILHAWSLHHGNGSGWSVRGV